MSKKILIILSTILLLTVSIQHKQIQAATCPLTADTKTNMNTTLGACYSISDPLFYPGLNTSGGTQTCGPVRCIGDHTSAYPNGNTCVIQNANRQCFPGTGSSGFNTPNCTQTSTTPLPTCPKPMNLTMKVLDNKGNAITNYVTFTITYEDAPPGNAPGKVTTVSKIDTNGFATASGTLYSGDHFMIVPSSTFYTFTPPQIGSTSNLGDQEMNTLFSCGTQLENGSRPPCTFTAISNGTSLPAGPQQTVFTNLDTVLQDQETSAAETGAFIVAIAGGVFLINSLISNGKNGKK